MTSAHFDFTDARCIGVPLPGAEVRLVPVEGAYEIRVRGPMVTPGYFGRPDLTAAAFDARGYYRTGQRGGLADPGDPDAGLVFRGRIAEDFKLGTGTFVRVGAVRTALLSAAPLLADAVITGEDRASVCALAWLNAAEAAKLLGQEPRVEGELVTDETIRAELTGRWPATTPPRDRRPGSNACWCWPARPALTPRDHRQGLRQPAPGPRQPRRAGRVALRRTGSGRGCRGGKDGMMRQQSTTRPRNLTGQPGGPKVTGAIRARPLSRTAAGLGRAAARAWSLPPRRNQVAVEYDLEVPMSDGTMLLATHYIPVSVALGRHRAGPLPVRPDRPVRPADRADPRRARLSRAAAERARHVRVRRGLRADAARDRRRTGTVAWLRQQSWFEGRLATYGPSYLGFVQWALAVDPPPELVAAVVHVGPTTSTGPRTATAPSTCTTTSCGATWSHTRRASGCCAGWRAWSPPTGGCARCCTASRSRPDSLT